MQSILFGFVICAHTAHGETITYNSGTNTHNGSVSNNSTITLEGGVNTFNGTIGSGVDIAISDGNNAFQRIESNATIDIAGGDTTFNEDILNNANITVSNGTVIFEELDHSVSLNISGGSVTLTDEIEKNTNIVVTGGSLLLESGYWMERTSTEGVGLELAGGTLYTNGQDLDLHSLTLTADSVIDLGGSGANSIDLRNMYGFDNGYTLTFTNYADGDSISYANNNTGLSTAQLESQILFGSMQGDIASNQITPGEIAPVPEPSTWAGIGLVLGFALYRERGRILPHLRRKQAEVTDAA